MNNKTETTKSNLKKKGAHISAKTKAFITAASALMTSALCAFNAFALNIDTNYSVNTSIANSNPEGMIIGFAVWACRLIGIAMLIWGVYGYVTARKDGEAESMNGAIGKLVAGLVLICMPAVLKGLQVIS